MATKKKIVQQRVNSLNKKNTTKKSSTNKINNKEKINKKEPELISEQFNNNTENQKSTIISEKKKENNKNNKRKVVLNKQKSIKKSHKKEYNKDGNVSLDQELVLLKYRDQKGLKIISAFFINRIRVIKFDMKKFKKKFKYGTLKDKILILIMLFLIFIFSAFIAFAVYIIVNAPSMKAENLYKNNATVLFDMNDNEIARLGTENRELITYDELPEVLVDAIVATEDSRFFQHNGIDIARFSKAVIGQLMGRSDAGGGSTLTMQVSKNATGNSVSSGIKGLIRKFTDIYLSVFVLEKQYTKEQIIEFYVNIPNLGSGSYGVEQASKTYFGKSVADLTLAEASLIAGLFQAPSAYNPYVYPEKAQNRRNMVLNLMYKHGYISESERDAAKEIPVKSLLAGRDTSMNKYQGFIDTVVEEVENRTGNNPYAVPMKIKTTLDPKRQDVINDIYDGKFPSTKGHKWKNDVAQAGIAVIDVKTGALVAVGAGRNKTTLSSWNFATQERRHPGSTAKPVLDYGPAIEYLGWGTGTTVIDDTYKYSSGGSIKNFDNGFKGIMTAKTALAQSRNIPALYTFQQTTSEQKNEFATKLGWTHVEDDGNGNILETCSIGGFNGVTPLEMAAAYSTFARGGTYIEPYSFTEIEYTDSGEIYTFKPKKHEAMSESTAYLVTQILKHAVSGGYVGVGKVSGTEIAAKTGTSTVDEAAKKYYGWKGNPIGDSWEVAYSPDYAVATWYGYKERRKDYYLVGKEGSAARKAITRELTKGIFKKNSKFKKPDTVVTAEIELETDPIELASKNTPEKLRAKEYFKKGTQPTTVSTRFETLKDPSNLTYNASDVSVKLAWNEAPIPDAINQEYLTKYFKESKLYSKWGDKYLNKRNKYNETTFGTFGYRIYANYINGTSVDLGFTTGTTFNATLNGSIKSFTVKSCYQKFKNNQSAGITVDVSANTNNLPTTPTDVETTTTSIATTYIQGTLNASYLGASCTTVQDFKNRGSSPTDIWKVTIGGVDISNQAHYSSPTCYEITDTDEDKEVSCGSMVNGKSYDVWYTISYGNTSRKFNKTLSSNCR